MRAARIESVLAGIHTCDHREGILVLSARRQLHQVATGIDQRNVRTDPGERDGRSLLNFDAQPIWHETHYAGRLHPGNLLELLFALGQWNEKDVAADVSAHHLHDLSVRHVLGAGNFNLIAGIDAKTPVMLSVAVEDRARRSQHCKNNECQGDPLQPIGSFLGERSAPDRDSLLSAQEWRFLLRFEIDQTCVVERFPLESPFIMLSSYGKRIQLFLDGSGT